jgi:formylmethanofuran dehydrogenase subunit C
MLRLRYRGVTSIPVEAECIRPDLLADKSVAAIAALPLWHGNAQVSLGEFFHVEGNAGEGEVVVEGDCRHVKLLGAGTTRGRLTIRGDVGMHLGAAMRGGAITVYGNAGDWLGAEMRGGLLHVHGDAGDLAGAAYRGSRAGMRGGALLIDGNAGNEIGATMRRGLIAVGGAVGDFAGASMIAGSIFLFGRAGLRAGAGIKRGTLAFFDAQPQLLPTFRRACAYRPLFIHLYLRQLRTWGFAAAERFLDGEWQRWCGDGAARGKGEILIRQSEPRR